MTSQDSPIAFLLGSDSDLPTLEGAFESLEELGVKFHVRVLSAHRTPDEACEFARQAQKNGVKVLIGVAGMAAHLAGALGKPWDRRALNREIGRPRRVHDPVGQHATALAAQRRDQDLDGRYIAIDCHHGTAFGAAPSKRPMTARRTRYSSRSHTLGF